MSRGIEKRERVGPSAHWARSAESGTTHAFGRVRKGGWGASRLPSLRSFALGVFLLSPVRAHDIYSSWVEARVLADRLEVTLTLARASAPRLLGDERQLPAVTPETFREFAPRLRAAAPELVQIRSVDQPLAPTAPAEVAISGDADVTFTLRYPRPAAGKLALFAYYLRYLVDGHVATLVVTNAGGDDLGWSPATIDQPVLQTTVPAAPPALKPQK